MAGRRNQHLGPSATIQDNIEELTRINSQLERKKGRIGGRGDTQSFRKELAGLRSKGKQLCKEILGDLKARRGGGSRQMMMKLKRDFERALEKFTQVARAIERKEEETVAAISSSAAATSPLQNAGMQEQEQAQDFEFTEADVATLEARRQGIQQIERDVLELGEMFQDLQGMVAEQQTNVDMIENNISTAHDKVVSAQKELEEAEELQAKARKRKFCLFMIILVIIGAVVGIAVAASKK